MGDSRRLIHGRIAVAWEGLPSYAARLIRAGIHAAGTDVAVIGTPPAVPIRGMAEALGQDIVWIQRDDRATWSNLGLDVPRAFFRTGWAVPAFNRLSSEVKRRGGSVVAFVDNIPRRDFRQLAGAAAFRTIFRNRFDAVMVPGALGRVLAKKFGMASRGVFGGMYGADPEIFFPPPTNQGRADEFLFVGQFIERKGIDLLSRAFAEVRKRHPSYRLRMVGSGPLRGRLSADGAVVEDFLQPEEVSARYREAKFFVLPSRDEHWGLVVHEAALCGQVLLVSDAVGSAPDLVASDNGFVFRANDARALESAMESAIALDEINYDRMSERSGYNARAFGPQAWARSFLAILDYIGVSVERAPVLT